MSNFFSDNRDIQFLLDYYDMREIAALQERETPNGAADYAPRDVDDAVDNYRKVLEIVTPKGTLLMKTRLLRFILSFRKI